MSAGCSRLYFGFLSRRGKKRLLMSVGCFVVDIPTMTLTNCFKFFYPGPTGHFDESGEVKDFASTFIGHVMT